MFKITLLISVTLLSLLADAKMKIKPINKDMVKAIRSKTSEWVAHDPDQNPLGNLTVDDLLSLVGTILPTQNSTS